MRPFSCSVAVLCLLAAAGCSDPRNTEKSSGVGAVAGSSRFAFASAVVDSVSHFVDPKPDPTRRFIEVRHKLVVEAEEPAKAWNAAADYCSKSRCEIVASSFTGQAQYGEPSGRLSLRMAPDDFPGLLRRVGASAVILEHVTQTEDKTAQTIDVDAQLKNLAEFRERLRSMQRTSGGALEDVLEVHRELVRVQTELDGASAKRRLLAQETEKTAVEIAFVPRRSMVSAALAPLAGAFGDLAFQFTQSLGSLITAVVVVLPWLVLVLPLGWLLRRALRRRRSRDASMRPDGGQLPAVPSQ